MDLKPLQEITGIKFSLLVSVYFLALNIPFFLASLRTIHWSEQPGLGLFIALPVMLFVFFVLYFSLVLTKYFATPLFIGLALTTALLFWFALFSPAQIWPEIKTMILW